MDNNGPRYFKNQTIELTTQTSTLDTRESFSLSKDQAEAAKFALDQHSLVSIADIEGNILYVNDKFVEISGYKTSELIGKKHNVLNSNNQPKSYWQNMHETVLAGKVWHDEVRNRTKNGEFYWVDTTIVPNFDSNKKITGFTSIRTDITHQKHTLDNLAVAKDQAEAAKFALDQHSLVSIADIEGNILYVNEKFVEVSGYQSSELIGKKHSVLNSNNQPKSYWQNMHETVLAGKVWHDEVRNRAKNGEFYWVDTTIVPNFDNNKKITGFTSIRTDITQEKENRIQLSHAKEKAEIANKAKDDFLANMSHEIRTPMNAIYTSLQILNRNNQCPDGADLLNSSIYSCENLLTIINDILDFSKIESGMLEIESKEFSFRKVVNSVISDVLPTVNTERVELCLNYPKDIWDYWKGDSVRVRQVALNLLSNAVKFTKRGKITLAISYLEEDNPLSGLTLKVCDTGIGMSQEALDKLFQRFSQADTSTTRRYGGTGLGMAITLSLIELMKGEIRVKSELGSGTSLTLKFPLKHSNNKDKSTQKSNIEECPNLKGKTILLTDDNRINRLVLRKALTPTDANVIEAENGKVAFECVQERQIDLILMDIQMPILDGVSAFKLLRENQFSMPIIACTANVLVDDVKKYKKEGFNDYLAKPLNINTLYYLLNKYM